MKARTSRGVAWVVGIVASFGVAGAAPDSGSPQLEHVARVDHAHGAGLVVRDGFAYVSAVEAGFFVADVRDPPNAAKGGELGDLKAEDVALLDYPGRRVAVLAEGGVDTHMHFVDVTDPEDPEVLVSLDMGVAVHNVAVAPGTTLVYNARGGGRPMAVDIVDATDPQAPFVRNVWEPGDDRLRSCHDLTVFPTHARAYCAAANRTIVLDVTDLLEPVVLSTIQPQDLFFHHTAFPNQDHSLLIISDENRTMEPAITCSLPELPVLGCLLPAEPEPKGGTVWFYDLADPEAPAFKGLVEPPIVEMPDRLYSAHDGDFVGDRPLLAYAWFGAGLVLIDFSDPEDPLIVDRFGDDLNPWDAKYWNGHLFTGDLDHGLDVFEVVGD